MGKSPRFPFPVLEVTRSGAAAARRSEQPFNEQAHRVSTPPETIGRGPVGQKINQFISDKNFNPDLIPFDHMYFLSVEDYEDLISVVADNQLNLSEYLRTVVERDKDMATRKFTIGQHIHADFPNPKTPDFVVNSFEEATAELERKLSRS